jgi:hypothetical protein
VHYCGGLNALPGRVAPKFQRQFQRLGPARTPWRKFVYQRKLGHVNWYKLVPRNSGVSTLLTPELLVSNSSPGNLARLERIPQFFTADQVAEALPLRPRVPWRLRRWWACCHPVGVSRMVIQR